MSIDLDFQKVSKKYRLRLNGDAPRRWYRQPFAGNRGEMWALRDVTFQVREGEALGIVGHNGAGKTTILRILSGITAPTEGKIKIRGRVAALVEVSSGFHPELTGMENIYLHGAMLGMRRSEIRRKLESIIDFAGVGRYIGVPVKRYSSGMFVRLGFAIAAHLDPDILLLDEILAVGDVAFQTKCLERIGELRKSGRTIVFISHDLAAVYRLCDRALLLNRGAIFADGPPRQVIDQYQQLAFAGYDEQPHDAHKLAECTSVSFTPLDSAEIQTGHPMKALIGYRTSKHLTNVIFRISLYWPSGYLCSQFTTESSGRTLSLAPGSGTIEFECPMLSVSPGLYRIDLVLESNGEELDLRQRSATLRVEPGKCCNGDFYIENTWKIVEPRSDSTSSIQEEV